MEQINQIEQLIEQVEKKIGEVQYKVEWCDEHDEDNKGIMVSWDCNDDFTDKIMNNDYHNFTKNMGVNLKKNMKWLNDIRKMTNIKNEQIYIDIKQ